MNCAAWEGMTRSARAAAACASGGTAAILAMEAVRCGLCETAVLAGVDGLSSENVSFFQVMQAMSPGEARPFDEARDGMNVGELHRIK